MDNWHAEAERFCPSLRVRLWRGEELGELEAARSASDLIVFNYAQLRVLSPGIAQLAGKRLSLTKRRISKTQIPRLPKPPVRCELDTRVALTGTPIENRLLDLWSIIAFAMPGVLGNRAAVHSAPTIRKTILSPAAGSPRGCAVSAPPHQRPGRQGPARAQSKRISLAKWKANKAPFIVPSSSERSKFCSSQHSKRARTSSASIFLTSLLRLRQICCHPALVSEELHKAESAKLNALIDLLEPLIEGGPQSARLLAVRRHARHPSRRGEAARVAALLPGRQTPKIAANWWRSFRARRRCRFSSSR